MPRLYEGANGVSRAVHSSTDQFVEIIAQLERLSLISMSELVVMVGNGHGVGALRIVRSMIEYAINALYLLKFPESRELFLGWHFVEQHKLLVAIERDGLGGKLDPEKVRESEEGFDRVKPLFLNKKGELRGSWCNLDLGSRARAAGLEFAYDLVNPKASKIVHGTISGLAQQFFTNSGGGPEFVSPPSLKECDMALQFGHFSELVMLDVLGELGNIKSNLSLDQLDKDYGYAWGTPDFPRAHLAEKDR